MKLYIKNMVCGRCKMVVKSELEKLGLHIHSLELGEVEISENLTEAQKKQVMEALLKHGFDLIDDKKSQIIEKIKALIVDLVHHRNNELKINLSTFLAEELERDYTFLSNLFSEVESSTIEKFYIQQKIEKVKELLMYDELTLNEIAFQLNYSSVAHLSNQFKKVTGFSPSYFKQLKDRKRKQIDQL